MQTDPNWTNFLWNQDAPNGQLGLIDFGATREYSTEFIELYRRLLLAAVRKDRDACLELSRDIGYLTGDEIDVSLARARI